MNNWTFGLHSEQVIDRNKTVECRYCRSDFKPRFYPVPGDPTLYRRQRFCSALCRRLWDQEQKEDANQ